eukprot:TRINITY_DN28040_c0_g1_i1.p1 TRINITY_DN28040_c0_g1~~TRINITY_DN28040_c0_g1_i1.p1  ORF type:complete len:262 (-),score=17.48 TRINITY_DN28040_c0_g1_i1:79-831(-)
MTLKRENLIIAVILALFISDAQGIKCYTCGLEEYDPNLDKAGTYNTTVVPGKETGYKMYNHTCFEMNTKTGQNVPFTFTRELLLDEMATVEEADEVAKYLKTANPRWNLDKGFLIYESEYLTMIGLLSKDKKPAIPDWKNWENIAVENYNMDMWIRDCGDKVQHCYQAEGDYDSQLPTFRGCAGTDYIYDNQCFHEMQAVTVSQTPKRSVDVGVTLCYCGSDLCNTELSSAPRLILSSLLVPVVLFVILQ